MAASAHKTPLPDTNYRKHSIPDSPHAISFLLPSWGDVLSYQARKELLYKESYQGKEFLFLSPFIERLMDECSKKFEKKNECTFIYPSKRVALRAQKFVYDKTKEKGRIHNHGKNGIYVVCYPEKIFPHAKRFSLLCGDVVSSRMAEDTLNEDFVIDDGTLGKAKAAKKRIREKIADITGERPQNVALFPTERSAIANVHRFLQISFPDRKSIQFGIPHSNSLRIQREFGNGVHFFPNGDADDFEKLEEVLSKEKSLGIFCEFPGNPIVRDINIKRLKILCRKHTIPLILDDTLGTFQNFRTFSIADIVVSSLSRFYSGKGDVPGGALIVHTDSRFGQMFARVFRSNYEDLLWSKDAILLEEYGRDFEDRSEKIDENAKIIHDFLKGHPAVYKVFSSKFGTHKDDNVPMSEFGGVISFLLCNPEENTPRFYDALNLSKGPGFGYDFTIVCPYTQTNLFDEFEMAEEYGISPYLMQVSLGLENPDELMKKFSDAFSEMKG